MSASTVHHLFVRSFDDSRKTVTCADRFITPAQALDYMVRAELAFGSQIVSLTPTQIKTSSSCLGCIDNMTFSGDGEAMRELYDLCHTYNSIPCEYRPVVFPSTIAGAKFSKDVSGFLTDLAKSKGLLQATLATCILARASKVNIEALNRNELIDLFLMLATGSVTVEEVNEVFA